MFLLIQHASDVYKKWFFICLVDSFLLWAFQGVSAAVVKRLHSLLLTETRMMNENAHSNKELANPFKLNYWKVVISEFLFWLYIVTEVYTLVKCLLQLSRRLVQNVNGLQFNHGRTKFFDMRQTWVVKLLLFHFELSVCIHVVTAMVLFFGSWKTLSCVIVSRSVLRVSIELKWTLPVSLTVHLLSFLFTKILVLFSFRSNSKVDWSYLFFFGTEIDVHINFT